MVPASAIAAAVARFQALAAQARLTGPALVGPSRLSEMLAVSGLDAGQQTQFAALAVAHAGDPAGFWPAVTQALGPAVAAGLQVDGRLAYLTVNNAPLMQAIHGALGTGGLTDLRQLAERGYFRPEAWQTLLTAAIPVPPEIPGDTPAAQAANYAQYLAAQVRASYPTTAIAQLVGGGTLLPELASAPRAALQAFLTQHAGPFELGVQPVRQYLARAQIAITAENAETIRQIEQIQRVYQITPDDNAMIGLLQQGLDSAYRIVHQERAAFIQGYGPDLGGAAVAAQIHDRAGQIHAAVLSIAVSYLTAATGIPLGAARLDASPAGTPGSGQILRPAPSTPTGPGAGDIVAYPTLAGLVGALDYCTCDDCRSVLSPAAYLVDLLLYLDRDAEDWARTAAAWTTAHGGAPYPFPDPDSFAAFQATWTAQHPGAPLPDTAIPPLQVLLARRPDLQHLPLTCENTNTALPYIDVVNETLEYFVANTTQPLSLGGYTGHDTGEALSADLLASPQFVMDAAYTTLQTAPFPPPLPFHQPLENLRRYFAHLGAPLALAMERLRAGDDLERGTHAYGWRDILLEELALSREEQTILTDASAVPLAALYGFPATLDDSAVIAALANAAAYCTRVGLSYDELVSVLGTRFVNPAGASAAPDPRLIVLADPTDGGPSCSFAALALCHVQPGPGGSSATTPPTAAEYTRLLRFVRLWRKLGWPLAQTDAAVCALFHADLTPLAPADLDAVADLDTGFRTLLPRLGVVVRVLGALRLTPEPDLPPLLACWAPIDTFGPRALYQQMFLSPALRAPDPVFAADSQGAFLADSGVPLLAHAPALRAAFNLTGSEFDLLLNALGLNTAVSVSYTHSQPTLDQAIRDAGPGIAYDPGQQTLSYTGLLSAAIRDALQSLPGVSPEFQAAVAALYTADQAALHPLTLANLSAVYRRGWLARALRLSVRELLLLLQYAGLDPFAAPDPPQPALLALSALVQDLQARGIKVSAALYLIWNQDLSGKAAPPLAQITALARQLRGQLAAVRDELAVVDDPTGTVARARMALVYGPAAADFFFSLLDATFTVEAPYSQPDPALAPPILAAAPPGQISYDPFRKQLRYSGGLRDATRAALVSVPGVSADFQTAVGQLFAASQAVVAPFFARYPELAPLYTTYVTSADAPAAKRAALLAAVLPALTRRRQEVQALAVITAAARTDALFTQAILQDAAVLHAAGDPHAAAVVDLTALEQPGLQVHFAQTDANGAAVAADIAAAPLRAPGAGGDAPPLPAGFTGDRPLAAVWTGYLEAPATAFYNLAVDAGSDAGVTLTLGGSPVALDHATGSATWTNHDALALTAGTLYPITLAVTNLSPGLAVRWATAGQGATPIPTPYLYAAQTVAALQAAFVRLLKAAALADGLRLTAQEFAHIAADSSLAIGGAGWLNALPVAGDPDPAAGPALRVPLRALLDVAALKAGLSAADEDVLNVLQDPVGAAAPEGALFRLTHWDRPALDTILGHFGMAPADLAQPAAFARVAAAMALLSTTGIPAPTLLAATTNAPTGAQVRDLQAALGARYDPASWRQVVQPINDALRSLQRDALVAYVLHGLRTAPATATIDTPDKLFEYLLMDVQMDPCMETSRIRHALSSVQLFVERSLLDLEPGVAPSVLDAGQWAWMKRYRVWEANRKVFLWPENWLEPELRDDKSPFFKEVETALLQSDITDESATTALIEYLTRLDSIAKLEPCALCHAAGPGPTDAAIDHVIARTVGIHRTYYYSRRTAGARPGDPGTWTPWEPIKLDIEDTPVLPVVWQNRLLLFWLHLQKKPPLPVSPFSGAGPLTALRTENLNTAPPPVTTQALLCWSEYANGAWQPTRTSDLAHALEIDQGPPSGPDAFDRARLQLGADEVPLDVGASGAPRTALRLTITGGRLPRPSPGGTNTMARLGGLSPGGADPNSAAFLLYTTHSRPVPTAAPADLGIGLRRSVATAAGALDLDYSVARLVGAPTHLPRRVLTDSLNPEAVTPHQPLPDVWSAPLVFADDCHAFFVTTAHQPVWIRDPGGYGVPITAGLTGANAMAPLVLPPPDPGPARPHLGAAASAAGLAVGAVDPAAMQRFVSEDAYIHRGLGATGRVLYGSTPIGPAGAEPGGGQGGQS